MNEISIENLVKQKKEAKSMLGKKFSFSEKKPLVAIILDQELEEKEEVVLNEILQGVTAVDVEVVILADSNLNIAHPHVYTLPYSQKARTQLLSAADTAICFEFNDVEEMLLNGVIPISAKREELENYNPNHENGNSFIYKEESSWGIFAALVRALETFRLPYDWNTIVRNGIDQIKS